MNSCGILAWRRVERMTEVLLVHPGGPYFARKDNGAWSIPKGEAAEGEDLQAAALREFAEEIGTGIDGDLTPLAPVQQKGGKTVHAWAVEVKQELMIGKPNTFTMEWPPHTGYMREFPEIDKAEWFATGVARNKINKAQSAFIDELERMLIDN